MMKGFTQNDTQSDARAARANELRSRLAGEVRFDPGSRALYATDASNYRQVSIGVVIPKSVEDVIETVSLARSYGAPILARGGGTSLAGQCCNSAIVMDTSKYLNKLIEIDAIRRTARVQPGIVLDDLNREAWKFSLAFGPDPSTHNHCTLGGMIGNNGARACCSKCSRRMRLEKRLARRPRERGSRSVSRVQSVQVGMSGEGRYGHL